MRRAVIVALSAYALLAGIALPAFAPLRPGLSVSPQKTLDAKDYPPITGHSPIVLIGTPSGCHTTLNWCDTVPLDLGAPKEITGADTYLLKVILFWPDVHTEGEERRSSNWMGVYLWDCPNYKPPSTYGTCMRNDPPSGVVGDPPPRIIKVQDFPGKLYFITPQNLYGPNLGYRLTVEYQPQAFRPGSVKTPPPGPTAPSGSTTVRATPAPARPPASQSEPEPKISFSPVKVPGPDGEPTTVMVPVLAKGGLKPVEGRGLSPFVFVAAGVLLLGGVVAVLMIRRRRRTNEMAPGAR